MGRPKGSTNKPKANGGKAAGPKIETTTHNLAAEPLTDEQHHALVASWTEKYEKLEAVFKTAGANLKNCARAAKAEKVLLKDIRAYQDGGTEEGQKKLIEEAERLARIARWRNFELGQLFTEEEAPRLTRSFTLGKEAGMAGEKAVVGSGCDREEWMKGWSAGQAIKMSGFQEMKAADAQEFN